MKASANTSPSGDRSLSSEILGPRDSKRVPRIDPKASIDPSPEMILEKISANSKAMKVLARLVLHGESRLVSEVTKEYPNQLETYKIAMDRHKSQNLFVRFIRSEPLAPVRPSIADAFVPIESIRGSKFGKLGDGRKIDAALDILLKADVIHTVDESIPTSGYSPRWRCVGIRLNEQFRSSVFKLMEACNEQEAIDFQKIKGQVEAVHRLLPLPPEDVRLQDRSLAKALFSFAKETALLFSSPIALPSYLIRANQKIEEAAKAGRTNTSDLWIVKQVLSGVATIVIPFSAGFNSFLQSGISGPPWTQSFGAKVVLALAVTNGISGLIELARSKPGTGTNSSKDIPVSPAAI